MERSVRLNCPRELGSNPCLSRYYTGGTMKHITLYDVYPICKPIDKEAQRYLVLKALSLGWNKEEFDKGYAMGKKEKGE